MSDSVQPQCRKVKSESEVTQSCPTLSDPHGLQPTRLLRPWDFPGKRTGVVCHCFLRKSDATAKSLQSCPTLSDPHGLQPTRLLSPWDFPGTAAYQAPQSMGFSRQEYWSGVASPSPEISWMRLLQFPPSGKCWCASTWWRSANTAEQRKAILQKRSL